MRREKFKYITVTIQISERMVLNRPDLRALLFRLRSAAHATIEGKPLYETGRTDLTEFQFSFRKDDPFLVHVPVIVMLIGVGMMAYDLRPKPVADAAREIFLERYAPASEVPYVPPNTELGET